MVNRLFENNIIFLLTTIPQVKIDRFFPKYLKYPFFPLPYPAPIFPLSDSANHDPKAGPVPDAKIFKDAELINMIDPILEADDRNKALYIIIKYFECSSR